MDVPDILFIAPAGLITGLFFGGVLCMTGWLRDLLGPRFSYVFEGITVLLVTNALLGGGNDLYTAAGAKAAAAALCSLLGLWATLSAARNPGPSPRQHHSIARPAHRIAPSDGAAGLPGGSPRSRGPVKKR